jgi:site-specific DNA-adenine methylase
LSIRTPISADTVSDLPRQTGHVGTPPLKCQGIKTKLILFIFQGIEWTCANDARWIDPFVGSGVVALNLAPQRAVLADANPHIINFFRAIQRGQINANTVREFLSNEGAKLAVHGADYYYEVRARFNESGSPFDFLILNRSCLTVSCDSISEGGSTSRPVTSLTVSPSPMSQRSPIKSTGLQSRWRAKI